MGKELVLVKTDGATDLTLEFLDGTWFTITKVNCDVYTIYILDENDNLQYEEFEDYDDGIDFLNKYGMLDAINAPYVADAVKYAIDEYFFNNNFKSGYGAYSAWIMYCKSKEVIND